MKSLTLLLALFCWAGIAHGSTPQFTVEVAEQADGALVMAQKGRNALELYSADGRELIRSIPLTQPPTGLAVDGDVAYVTTFRSQGLVEVVSLRSAEPLYTISVGSGACSPRLSPCKGFLYLCNSFEHAIAKIDLSKRKVVQQVKVDREPKELTLCGAYIFVANFLPNQRADADWVGAMVSVVDQASFTWVKDIPLANGSNALRAICATPDQKYIYVSHNLGRYTVPTSQLQQGWMNTSAFSVVDAEALSYVGSILVDEPERGAAGVWDIECNEQKIFITHSGTHEVSIIDHKRMLEKLEAYPDKESLDYDLRFLQGLRQRIPIEGNGPRSMLLREDDIVVPTYFEDMLNVVEIESAEVHSVSLNPNRAESMEQRGEKYFNDATLCFQSWQSCNGCHPGDGRTDGMNWDLMNDGVGNPKNCKSLLYSSATPPVMITGIRPSAEYAIRTGYRYIQFYDVPEEYARCVDAYVQGLEAVPSPLLVDGKLSKQAKQGEKVFEKLRCSGCHSGAYYTDMKMHRIGEDVEFEKGWDTPTLREVWRTAPYLFDGRAKTIEEVFSIHKHGIREEVSPREIEALTEYVLSL